MSDLASTWCTIDVEVVVESVISMEGRALVVIICSEQDANLGYDKGGSDGEGSLVDH